MVKEYYKKIKELGIGKLLLILFAGILLVLSCFTDSSKEKKKEEIPVQNGNTAIRSTDDLASSMEEILAKIDGVSAVSVMVTYEDSGEKILVSSKNTESEKSEEEDSAGGNRTQEKQSTTEDYLYAGDDPYVVMETKPSICGVLIVYKGDASVTKDITEAAKVLTGVDYNRIKVLFMN
ncbi:MAG: hypothetical protein PUF12_01510 [Thermoflexaceae bacterium]|nr:hypothetical protein [Thermoflexaceae bacterium]